MIYTYNINTLSNIIHSYGNLKPFIKSLWSEMQMTLFGYLKTDTILTRFSGY